MPVCELSLMCQICQSFSTMLKEAFVTAMQPAGPLWRSADGPSHSALCVSVSSHWPIVEAGQADPTSGIWRGPCLVCVSASPCLPCQGFHCPPPLPFLNQTPPKLHRSGEIINCPFVLAAISTEENKLMVMNSYRVWFRCRLK